MRTIPNKGDARVRVLMRYLLISTAITCTLAKRWNINPLSLHSLPRKSNHYEIDDMEEYEPSNRNRNRSPFVGSGREFNIFDSRGGHGDTSTGGSSSSSESLSSSSGQGSSSSSFPEQPFTPPSPNHPPETHIAETTYLTEETHPPPPPPPRLPNPKTSLQTSRNGSNPATYPKYNAGWNPTQPSRSAKHFDPSKPSCGWEQISTPSSACGSSNPAGRMM